VPLPMMLTLFIYNFFLCKFNSKKWRWRCQATIGSQASLAKSMLLRSGSLEYYLGQVDLGRMSSREKESFHTVLTASRVANISTTPRC
jgi:hypothetical protein